MSNLLARLPLLGTAEFPLRPSSLDKLVKCQVWHVMLLEDTDEGGPAAQTGSVVHAAIAAFHQTLPPADKIKAAIDALGINGPKFPLHDAHEAKLYLTPYLADPRNNGPLFAVIPHREYTGVDDHGKSLPSRVGDAAIEVPVRLVLPPHPIDPTGQPIVIQGTLDQIRYEHGDELVDDVKTGQRSGFEMIHDYALQQAAYVLAARQSGFPNAKPGRIIRVYGYRARGAVLPSPGGVFWQMPFTVAGAEALMERVRLTVALVRGGTVEFGTGAWCTYCNFKGFDTCYPIAQKRLFALPMA